MKKMKKMRNQQLRKITRYNEIFKLKKMLNRAEIRYSFHTLYDGFILVLWNENGKMIADVIQHNWSYGSHDGHLEEMGLMDEEDVVMTNAIEVFKVWRKAVA